MTRAELLRRRRCRLLQLAMFFGILFPIFTRTWASLVVAVVGVTVLAYAWRRDCRGLRGGGQNEEPPPGRPAA